MIAVERVRAGKAGRDCRAVKSVDRHGRLNRQVVGAGWRAQQCQHNDADGCRPLTIAHVALPSCERAFIKTRLSDRCKYKLYKIYNTLISSMAGDAFPA